MCYLFHGEVRHGEAVLGPVVVVDQGQRAVQRPQQLRRGAVRQVLQHTVILVRVAVIVKIFLGVYQIFLTQNCKYF